MIPQKVYDWCKSHDTISSELARDPTQSPGAIIKRLYGDTERLHLVSPGQLTASNPTPEDLQRAFECGNWGPTRPSDLFLTVCTTRAHLHAEQTS